MRQWNAYADEVAPPVQSFSLTPIRIVEVQKDYVPRDRLPNPIEGRTSNWPKLDASSLKREGFADIVTTTNSREALRVFEERTFDLVLLDLMMPGLDGFALLQAFGRLIPGDVYLPILVLTADATLPKRHRALALGSKDFLTKPFDAIEVILRIFNLLETRVLMLELASDMHGVLMAVIGLPAENNCKAGIAGISALLECREINTRHCLLVELPRPGCLLKFPSQRRRREFGLSCTTGRVAVPPSRNGSQALTAAHGASIENQTFSRDQRLSSDVTRGWGIA